MRGGDDQIFDFNRIVPMPELLRHTASGGRDFPDENGHLCRVSSWYVIDPDLKPGDPGWDKNERAFAAEERAALTALGHHDWYDWSTQHWGTKWNACHIDIEEFREEDRRVDIHFDTAWSAPFPVFRAIAAKFPQLVFEFSWTDEDEPGLTHSLTIRSSEEEAQLNSP